MSNINDLANELRFVKFLPEFNSRFKSVQATLLMGRLEYWFSRYENGFYKFMEPCSHPQYRDGDSLTEELSLTRKVLNRAFDLVGVRYSSKSAFEAAEDTFQGKLYASYYDRKENKTYYIRNHKLISELFSKLSPLKSSLSSQKSQKEGQGRGLKKRPFYNGHLGRSPIYNKDTKNNLQSPPISPSNLVEGEKREEGGFNFKKEKKESFTSEQPSEIPQKDWELALQLREIWIEKTKNLIPTPPLRETMVQKLLETFENRFSSSLRLWTKYCERVGSSLFLTGQTGGKFKLWLVRALKDSMIQNIHDGKYGVDTSISLEDPDVEKKKQEKRLESLVQGIMSCSVEEEGVKSFRLALLKKIGGVSYKAWFDSVKIYHERGQLMIQSPRTFTAKSIETKFSDILKSLLTEFSWSGFQTVVIPGLGL